MSCPIKLGQMIWEKGKLKNIGGVWWRNLSNVVWVFLIYIYVKKCVEMCVCLKCSKVCLKYPTKQVYIFQKLRLTHANFYLFNFCIDRSFIRDLEFFFFLSAYNLGCMPIYWYRFFLLLLFTFQVNKWGFKFCMFLFET